MARRSGRARRHPPGLEESPHGLERKQFIRRERHSSLAGETQYAFLHVLLRDAAYGQIPRATRAGKHLKAAGWIESLGRPDDHAEMLAHHYLAALELARAAHQDTTGLVFPVIQDEDVGVIDDEDVWAKNGPAGWVLAGPWCAWWRGGGQSVVTSVTAARALCSSTMDLRPAMAATRAWVAMLFTARGRPRAASWMSVMASSLKSVSARPVSLM